MQESRQRIEGQQLLDGEVETVMGFEGGLKLRDGVSGAMVERGMEELKMSSRAEKVQMGGVRRQDGMVGIIAAGSSGVGVGWE